MKLVIPYIYVCDWFPFIRVPKPGGHSCYSCSPFTFSLSPSPRQGHEHRHRPFGMQSKRGVHVCARAVLCLTE